MIAVTGGAGFIGSCLVKELNERGIYDILVVDRLGTGVKWKNLVGKKFASVEHKDTFRTKLLAGGYKADIEAIFHLGACSSTTETDADYLLDNNYQYSKDIALYAEARNIRFIYASSAATYGAGEQGYADTEFDTLRPLNMYGYSKHLFDEWVLRHGLDHKFVGLKFFNVFGPNEYHKGEMASLVFKAYHQILDTGVLRLFKSYRPEYADGEQKRDFVYVKDCTRVMADMLKFGEIAGIFNLGSGVARSWNDLARAVFAAMNRPMNVEYVEMPAPLRSQYQYFTQADMSKLQQTRVFAPPASLEDAVQDYVGAYLSKGMAYH
jgi:ADP-L-glycero-D-manno-heptose 6-epimerase